MTDSSTDQYDGAAKRVGSPLSSPNEATKVKIAPQATLSAKGETTMPLADSPSVPTTGVLEGEMVVEQSPFMRIPAELRIPIYTLLVLAPPIKHVECSFEGCTDGSSFLASTCKPVSSQIRTFISRSRSCSCPSHSHDVHLEILRTSRQIYHEASAVLYENVEVLAFSPWEIHPRYPSPALAPHIRHLCWAVPCGSMSLRNMIARVKDHLPDFPNLQVVRLHQDVDLTASWSKRLDNTTLDLLTRLGDQVEFVIDVHIVNAWAQGGDEEDWDEQIGFYNVREQRKKELDGQAVELRQQLVTDLSEAFKRKGKVLKVREEGIVEAEAAGDQQDGMMKLEVAEGQQDGLTEDAEVAEDQQEG
ncbi:unnamed protein product [Zymoseptoria tritici ST99CH_3D7]|uniref:DUF7730 domain-containing protein n=1 Tax=Zymoseptoria tritici (strain ST99CH_3D7) TaxID=1276538 RepID=A0A1X7S722_ZYMT9|nr:unnamed protein product [Zymoseptoria tritici ST99CH_3D7]